MRRPTTAIIPFSTRSAHDQALFSALANHVADVVSWAWTEAFVRPCAEPLPRDLVDAAGVERAYAGVSRARVFSFEARRLARTGQQLPTGLGLQLAA